MAPALPVALLLLDGYEAQFVHVGERAIAFQAESILAACEIKNANLLPKLVFRIVTVGDFRRGRPGDQASVQ
jgi:hypothetical protein